MQNLGKKHLETARYAFRREPAGLRCQCRDAWKSKLSAYAKTGGMTVKGGEWRWQSDAFRQVRRMRPKKSRRPFALL